MALHAAGLVQQKDKNGGSCSYVINNTNILVNTTTQPASACTPCVSSSCPCRITQLLLEPCGELDAATTLPLSGLDCTCATMLLLLLLLHLLLQVFLATAICCCVLTPLYITLTAPYITHAALAAFAVLTLLARFHHLATTACPAPLCRSIRCTCCSCFALAFAQLTSKARPFLTGCCSLVAALCWYLVDRLGSARRVAKVSVARLLSSLYCLVHLNLRAQQSQNATVEDELLVM
ncbi:hypothetical protein COO60DRAFT_1627187 [Scenedesmus sp. NREL 46B-D3]|nr:hypothetical protein COO60DRAFT_1631426 [Scenedesmus sp. NREL 46B-D3]KAF6247876.1 hypothetical protein COO60DRAFT_1630791 [Scenedesmus sp. NREL 46B-D3]KAF6256397.1 hypothetical protein COO60DRAFT_1627187 [Scenedesmus sp. NREL 46B-D3]